MTYKVLKCIQICFTTGKYFILFNYIYLHFSRHKLLFFLTRSSFRLRSRHLLISSLQTSRSCPFNKGHPCCESCTTTAQAFKDPRGKKRGMSVNTERVCFLHCLPTWTVLSLGHSLALFCLRRACAFPNITWGIANSRNYSSWEDSRVTILFQGTYLQTGKVEMRVLSPDFATWLWSQDVGPGLSYLAIQIGWASVSILGYLIEHDSAEACCRQAGIEKKQHFFRDNFKYCRIYRSR